MSNLQTTIQIRVEETLKNKASKALKNMGLDLSSGIKMFFTEVATSEAIPFYPSTTRGKKLRHYELYKQEILEAEKNGKRFNSTKEMLDDILRD